MLTAYHGTKYRAALAIVEKGFDSAHFPKWTSDLGRGIYGFMAADSGLGLEDPGYAAKMYPKIKYHEDFRVGVIKFSADISNSDICDLNDEKMRSNLQQSRKNFEKAIHQQFGQRVRSGASSRDNEDGILIEMLIQRRKWHNWKAIVCDTYTPFQARKSNFPNTREVCVRDLEAIKVCTLC
ncbi:MAG: hypothetical protein ABF743_01075 [Schleiferilactobacillus perolens]|uniref:hypothetical protein n=1 Tax=Schleiferilactobacillus perolens TaxID=100468 RepID=UPI0039E8CD61